MRRLRLCVILTIVVVAMHCYHDCVCSKITDNRYCSFSLQFLMSWIWDFTPYRSGPLGLYLRKILLRRGTTLLALNLEDCEAVKTQNLISQFPIFRTTWERISCWISVMKRAAFSIYRCVFVRGFSSLTFGASQRSRRPLQIYRGGFYAVSPS